MDIKEILTPDLTFVGQYGHSKKRLLEEISGHIAEKCPSFRANDVFDKLTCRERLGSTGFGNGIAIPHCRNPSCDKITGAFFRLKEPIDFDSIDNEPVDLVFVLVVPSDATEEHLETLSTIASMFDNSQYCSELRNAATPEELYQTAVGFSAN